jgi:diguanylate cyclase
MLFYLIAFLASSLTAGVIGYASALKMAGGGNESRSSKKREELEAQLDTARKAFSSLGGLLSRTHESVETQSNRLTALRRDLAERPDAEPAEVVAILQAELDRVLADNLRLSADLREARQTVARQEESLSELRKEARTDGLTRIANRREFDTRIFAQHDRFERLGETYSIIMVDIDHFKRVNDERGHQAGDKVIAGVAEMAASCINPADLAARYGGEEFAVMLPRATLSGAQRTAERIRQKVERTSFWCDDRPVTVTISLGVAQIQEEEALEALIRRADAALYSAKSNGRNQVQVSEVAYKDVEERVKEVLADTTTGAVGATVTDGSAGRDGAE